MKKKKSPPSLKLRPSARRSQPTARRSRRGEAGQVLLIVILAMVVTLTVGLSFISRSITNLRTSREEASSQKALAAAEAGIEQVLKTGVSIPIGTSFTGEPNTTYGTTANPVSGNQFLVNGGNVVPKDEGADIWLVPHNPSGDPDSSIPWSGNLTIFWGSALDICDSDPAINTMAAIEIVVVYDALSPKFNRFAFDPCPGRRSNNNFTATGGSGSVAGETFSFSSSSIAVVSGFVVRAVPLYTSTTIGVSVSIDLPSQGIKIDSTGDSSGTKRKINVFKGYPQLPIQYFSYGLFSP